MYMCICMCLYVCACMFVCVCASVHTHAHIDVRDQLERLGYFLFLSRAQGLNSACQQLPLPAKPPYWFHSDALTQASSLSSTRCSMSVLSPPDCGALSQQPHGCDLRRWLLHRQDPEGGKLVLTLKLRGEWSMGWGSRDGPQTSRSSATRSGDSFYSLAVVCPQGSYMRLFKRWV